MCKQKYAVHNKVFHYNESNRFCIFIFFYFDYETGPVRDQRSLDSERFHSIREIERERENIINIPGSDIIIIYTEIENTF